MHQSVAFIYFFQMTVTYRLLCGWQDLPIWRRHWMRIAFFFFSLSLLTLSQPYLNLSAHFSPSHSNMLRDQLHLQISWNQFSHWINKTIAKAVLGVSSCREEEHLHALLLLQTGTLLGWIVWLMKRTRSNPQLWHTHIEQCISHMTTQLCTKQKKKGLLMVMHRGFIVCVCCINYWLLTSGFFLLNPIERLICTDR